MTLKVAVVFPDLLGTYGDGGNGVILAKRASWRGLDAEVLQAYSNESLPQADIYCLGGAEDGPQVRAAALLREGETLRRRVDDGAVVLAVCAGYQIVGNAFPAADGTGQPGVGLLDVTTVKGSGRRAVGEILVEPTFTTTLPSLTGFENHGGRTRIGDGATALGRVLVGVGNGSDALSSGIRGQTPGSEGATSGRVLGTYLHGPVLARNPALADLLLTWALKVRGETNAHGLPPLEDTKEETLRAERIGALTASLTSRLRRLLRQAG